VNILCVIPSRLGSTRLSRKPLALIGDKPMVQWTYEAAKATAVFTEVVVATDSDEIAAVVEQAGGTAVMTDPAIKTGSDRVAVVAKHYPQMDIIVNLQGDEPFAKPEMLTALVQPFFTDPSVMMTTLACPLDRTTEYTDPNTVKVLVDKNGDALYFTRAPVPYFREAVEQVPVYQHQGVYAFRREFLAIFQTLPTTQLEQAELLEQLRVLEHGYKIRVCVTPHKIIEINTPEELELARASV
jgi:3-deoxy-manno-octulosonate cytidylyltransferase (CMP-KDO synthetase)